MRNRTRSALLCLALLLVSLLPAAAHAKPTSVPIQSAGASSVRKPDSGKNTYKASYAIDGDKTTCWTPALESERAGNGIGEYITLKLKNRSALSRLDIINGYGKKGKSDDLYLCNSRVKTATLYFSEEPSGDCVRFELRDGERDFQSVKFERREDVEAVTLVIDEIYEGQKWAYDICVSEIRLYDDDTYARGTALSSNAEKTRTVAVYDADNRQIYEYELTIDIAFLGDAEEKMIDYCRGYPVFLINGERSFGFEQNGLPALGARWEAYDLSGKRIATTIYDADGNALYEYTRSSVSNVRTFDKNLKKSGGFPCLELSRDGDVLFGFDAQRESIWESPVGVYYSGAQMGVEMRDVRIVDHGAQGEPLMPVVVNGEVVDAVGFIDGEAVLSYDANGTPRTVAAGEWRGVDQ